MNVNNLTGLYTEYLIVSPTQATTTVFSRILDNAISHDKIIRLLAGGSINSKKLWQYVKPICHEIQRDNGVLIIDDSVEGKQYTNKNELINWHFEQLDFPILICKQVFKNKDGSTGALYLASSDLSLSYEQTTIIYKKRWKEEDYHKSIKSNSSFAISPTRKVVTQERHFIASIMAYVKLERLHVRLGKNHFSLKSKLYVAASKAAYKEWRKLSTPNFEWN